MTEEALRSGEQSLWLLHLLISDYIIFNISSYLATEHSNPERA